MRVDRFVYAPAEGRLGLVLNVYAASWPRPGRPPLPPDSIRLETPAAVMGVRGTTLALRVNPDDVPRPVAVFVATLGVVVIAGCGPKRVRTTVPSGQSVVVLLPDPDDGAVGRAVVSNSVGATELVAARESTTVNPNQAPAPVTVISETDVTRLYGDVLSPFRRRRRFLCISFQSEESRESRAPAADSASR
jgi:hypothetical protein